MSTIDLRSPREPYADFVARLVDLVPVRAGAGPQLNFELLAVIDALMERLLAALHPVHPSQSTEATAAIWHATYAWREAVESWTYLSHHPYARKGAL